MNPPVHHRSRGFTLLEIMIVVLIVGILSSLAMVVIGKLRDRTVQSLIQNNLRQLYSAKEDYYTENPTNKPVSALVLQREGYISKRLLDALTTAHSLEASAGWRYFGVVFPSNPTVAFKGSPPTNSGTVPSGEAVFYPAAPDSAAAPTPPRRPVH